ncbi:maleylacetoacetate isomerase [Vibrio sp. ZSDE26]|uniref:Maleylacetoacetate isomerase n=1 Tax=Vibrio amylolyticus TaxID=2847292 RepID=A0A9X1XEW8_9VIBR|nr:maleylacetoacetate isomerase [Vibrio amylolyticus]
MTERTLYGYWRSSAAYRVRIALNLKKLDYQQVSVNLIKNGGEQHHAHYSALNPSELVPVLIDDNLKLTQSLSIIEYLDEQYPQCPLIPSETEAKYRVKALAQDIAIDIHPINNLRILQYLAGELELTDVKKADWYRHWIEVGFHSLEKKLAQSSGHYCEGDSLSLVDLCLVPQVYNANRFNVDMNAFPIIERINNTLTMHPAFIAAAPENQPDA